VPVLGGSNPLYELARRVTSAGPDNVAFDGLRVLQHPERFRKFLLGGELDIVPVTVQLWPSLSCDVRCPTCPYRMTDARDIADADENLHLMPLGLFRELIGSMQRAGVKSVFLTGGGEPLLHPDLTTMADDLHASGLAWGIFTNGITLNAQIAERLFRAKPGFFRVSLDAGNPALYKKIYATGPETFELVKSNIITAGRIASRLGYNWFGVGYAVMPNVTRADIVDMRNSFIELIEESDFGVNLASFRPRVVHHHNDQVVVPQKHSGRFRDLAELIRDEIERPIHARYGDRVRIDHKFGAFSDCDRDTPPRGGWGGSWIATLDHSASGSIVSHMTGASHNPSAWGSALNGGDFMTAWNSERRRHAQKLVIDGTIKLPVANGFRTIDAFLEKVKDTFPEPLDEKVVDGLMEGIEEWNFHRSKRPVFVG
jgi:pyruvate-formate lyase-activating enzyme